MRILPLSLGQFPSIAFNRIGIAAPFFFFTGISAFADCAPTTPGTIVCSGNDNDGYANTPGQEVAITVVNGATINSGGIFITGPGEDSIINSGNINGSLNGTVAGVGMSNMSIYVSGATNFSIDQNGSINQNIGVDSTVGTNTLTVRPGYSVNVVGLDGANNVVDNAGIFNSTLTLTADPGGQNAITNRPGAQLNTIVLNGTDNIIDNAGSINQSITIGGGFGGTNNIINRPGAIISGAINTTQAGAAIDRIDNDGIINNGVSLGAGNDYFVNRSGGTSGNPVTNGTIDTGIGNDFVIMAAGTINGQILLGAGADVAGISGGRITSSVDAGDGNDFLFWGGGTISSGLYGGSGDDSAIFSNLTSVNLTPGLVLDGGLGNDRMAWQNTQNAAGGQGTDVDTLRNWERISLSRGSQLTFEYGGDTLILGDTGTLTGQLNIEDASSSVIAGSPNVHSVTSAVAGNPILVSNAGFIDMVTGSSSEMNRFVVKGNYVGHEGYLKLQTYLDTDSDTRSDQLVIDGGNGGGSASGTTAISITNFGGPGALTNANGILVVDATNGATTSGSAFSLIGPVAAGIFEYQLFRGGVTSDRTTDQDWFLRSSVTDPTEPPAPPTPITPTVPVLPIIPVPPPVPPQPPQPPFTTDPTPITPTVPPVPPTPITPTVPPIPLDPAPPPGPPAPPPAQPDGPQIPLIRPEIPGYVIAPLIAADLGLETLSTFHERRGNQSLLDPGTTDGRAWLRAFGKSFTAGWMPGIKGMSYQMEPEFDGQFWGVQVGADLYNGHRDNGGEDRVGLFYAHSEATGDITGNVLARTQIHAGDFNLSSDSIGAYWTYLSEDSWYVDAVGMFSWLHGDATSYRGIGTDINGHSLTGSAEVGAPLVLNPNWTIEPQAQLIVQHLALDNTSDPFTSIEYDRTTRAIGRIGVRVEANAPINGRMVQVFGSVDLWHGFTADTSTRFNEDIVQTEIGGTSLQLQAGLNTALTDKVSAYGSFSYETSIDNRSGHGLAANAGLKLQW
ncbi:autotransporter domain-containing protein [Brucella intermedia]|uniref:autotransporter family protein n=1 Tax=Brucella TaxID=234 RepID=UPI001115306A|nr:autotransporter domain-containing protein [Brucella intermedia]